MTKNSDVTDTNMAAWIRDQRRSRNLTQTELAQMLQVSTAAVASWESGARKAKPKTLARFEAILAGAARDDEAPPAANVRAPKLTIQQAKEALARTYDVSPENIEIIIKG